MASPNDGIDRVTLIHQLHEEKDRIDEKVLKLEASVFQIVKYYFAFQGIIFTTVIKGSSSLKCQHVWLLFFMSMIVSVLNHKALSVLVNKYMVQLNALDKVKAKLYRHTFSRTFEPLHSWKEVRSLRRTSMMLARTLFFVFAVMCLIATWMIPCWS